ncbi:nodulation protein NfeD [Viridibacillus sp. YIM B01967]|uniref:Nodulation protein NfeD n=2 Tax=Viridibacillus soli TaxID=2798301 RepID=A0ABS1H1P1_9BACL|nr:nodulation protein NfeD [Viridibacillus soli]MBK3493330.1 nodulation protein NfeD [Viridibacillus soli]
MFFILLLPLTPVFAKSEVYHVPVEKEVEKGLHAFLQRAFKEADESGAKAVVLEIHTPGGFVNAAGDIAKLMDETPLRTIAFINKDAHSAGAFLALHADEIYMVPNGTIGAAAVIDSAGNMADQKANSAWLAQMQAAAETSNREPKYALAMADVSFALPEFRAAEGKLLTLTASEALKVNYSEGTVSSLQELLVRTGLDGAEIVEIDVSFAEQLARFITNPVIVPILLSIASLGLVLELYSPGFGVPGAMSIVAIILFFFGHLVAGFAGYESIVLLIVGIILIVAEFFLPGGIIGFLGFGAVILSLLLAGANVAHMAYSILAALLVAVIGMVILMKFFGKKMTMLNKMVLKDATDTEQGYVSNVNRVELIGREAVTSTPLRPSGAIMLEGERIDVVSEGGYIDAQKKVNIIKVEGPRIVVREVL